jgi:hypothetical protein
MHATDNCCTERDQLSEMAHVHLGIVDKNNFDRALMADNIHGAKNILAIAIAGRLDRKLIDATEAGQACSAIGMCLNDAISLRASANA